MHFDIPLCDGHDITEAITYVVRYITDRHPSVVVLGPGHERIYSRTIIPAKSVTMVLSEDNYTAAKLMGLDPRKILSSISIIGHEGTLCIRSNKKTEFIAEELSKLPLWSHKVKFSDIVHI
jgi:hypothetical protein